MKETQSTITAWANATFGIPATNLSIVKRARRELDELQAKLEVDDKHPGAAEEVADVVIVLSRLVEYLGADLQSCIDAKMAKNRERRWTLDGNGHGQHVASKEQP